jgi:hypothetical protein
MSAQIYPIRSWRELAESFLKACELSDPATAEPNGTFTFKQIENTQIVHLVISVDLVPRKI